MDVRFKLGSESNLPSGSSIVPGAYYQCDDSNKLYLGVKGDGSPEDESSRSLLLVTFISKDVNGEDTSLKTAQGSNNIVTGVDSTIISSTESTALGERVTIDASENSIIKSYTKNSSILASINSSIYIDSCRVIYKYKTRSDFPTTGIATDDSNNEVFYLDLSTSSYYKYNTSTSSYTLSTKDATQWGTAKGQGAIIASSNSKIDGNTYIESGVYSGTDSFVAATDSSEMKGLRSAIIGGSNHVVNHKNSVVLGGTYITTDRENSVFVPNIVFTEGSGDIKKRAILSAGNVNYGSTELFYFPEDGGVLLTNNNVSSSTNGSIKVNGSDITVYTHPSQSSATAGLYKISVDSTGHVTGTTSVAKSDITALGIPAQDTTYSDATTSEHGLMSSDDKTKLDGIHDSADSITVSQTLTSGTEIAKVTINGGTPISLYQTVEADTTYTFTSGTNGFTVTPSTGTAQTVTVTPSITNNALTTSTISGTVTGSTSGTAGVSGTVAAPSVTISKTTVTDALGYTPLETHQDISGKADKTATVSNVSYNSTSKKIQETINGTTTDVVTLATVATSGSYSDLSNKPTIPTVNNATLTIKAGGTSKGTFTANASSDVSVDITASDLGLSSAMQFGGVLSSLPTPTTTDSYSNGTVVLVGSKEYVRYGKTSTEAGGWEELGDGSSYALKSITITGTGALGGGGTLEENRTITHNTSGVGTATTTAGFYKFKYDTYGHVTGVTSVAKSDITGLGIPGSDTDRYVNSAAFADDSTATAASPVKMTLTRAGSDTSTVTANIPKVSSSSAGVAPKGTAVTTQSQTTKFLREDGSWAAPSYTSLSGYATQTWVEGKGYYSSSSTDTVPNVTNAGSATTASVSNGVLTITTGSAPTLGTAKTVVTSVS